MVSGLVSKKEVLALAEDMIIHTDNGEIISVFGIDPKKVENLRTAIIVDEKDEKQLTKKEACAVAEFIDSELINSIQQNTDFDSVWYLTLLMRAYDKLCDLGGYTTVTKPSDEIIERRRD